MSGGECAANFLREWPRAWIKSPCRGRAPLTWAAEKCCRQHVGGLIKHLFFHSPDRTFPPELNLHHSESTVKVLKSGSEGQADTDPH